MLNKEDIQPFASIENLGNLRAYQLSRDLSKTVWRIVQRWDWFSKSTIGSQWVRATDSISANFSEGYGAYFFNDSVKFYYYARRSLFECCDWFGKANERGLISKDEYNKIKAILDELPLEINKIIKRVRNNRNLYGQ